jgi:hypothetical protein
MKAIVAFLIKALNTMLRLLAALMGTYYSSKYAMLARRLSRPPVKADSKRGFVVIQIDGLSYDHLAAAMQLGYAPHLRHLIDRHEMRLHPWKPGVPGTTPASQAGIMYGTSDVIPAFRWYDKQTGQAMVCSQPGVIQALEEELSARKPGILRGGSSYMNIFDGDASLAMFTLGAIGRRHFFEGLRGLGFLALFALNPFRSGQMLLLSLWEYMTDLVQRTMANLRNTTPRPLGREFPFLRVMSNVVLREIQSFSMTLDIVRGVPALYTTYFGYDELAHHYGPLSKPALRALRAIDRHIRGIDRFRRMNLRRPYDLYILSDHGMTEGIPFSIEYGHTLGDLVHDLVGRSAAIIELYGAGRGDMMSTFFVQQELEAIEQGIRSPLLTFPRYLLHYIEHRLPVPAYSDALDTTDLDGEHATWSDVVVSSSGSLSHIYFNAAKEQLSLSRIIALYPTLVSSLVSHPGIWLVIARDEGRVMIIGVDGIVMVGKDVQIDGHNPLRQVAYSEWAVTQLARLALLENAGDLILLGRYDPDTKRVSCFEAQWACHGGLGGPQDMAMLMAESHIAWQDEPIEHATTFYDLFTRQYGLL